MKKELKWYNKVLASEDFNKVEQAITRAEKTTSGEIVPMVVASSISIRNLTPFLFAVLAAIYFCLRYEAMHWDASITSVWMDLLDIVMLWFLAEILVKFSFFVRLLTSKQDRNHFVHRRALAEFHLHKLHKTKGGTGVLIFISLLERKAVVLADETISSKVDNKVWNSILQELLFSAKDKKLGHGLVVAVEKVGNVLAEHFPAQASDTNEIRNQLIVKR